MNKLDIKLKRIAKNEPVEVPKEISDMIDTVLESLPDICISRKSTNHWKKFNKVAIASFLIILFMFPNLNPKIAHSMENIPLIGSIIKIITVRRYEYDDGNHTVDIKVPSVSVEGNDENSKNITNYINASVEELTNTLLDEFNNELYKADGKGHGSLNIDYEVVTNHDTWFTLKIRILETAASSNTYFKFYHIDKIKNEIIQLSDLFEKNSDYQKAISDNIHQQMVEQMENDDSIFYLIDSEFPEDNFHQINENQNFYFSEDNNIIIVFDKYEVAPGMMGCPEFEIHKSVYSEYLKK